MAASTSAWERALRKRLRQVEALEKRPRGALDAQQRKKLARAADIREALAELGGGPSGAAPGRPAAAPSRAPSRASFGAARDEAELFSLVNAASAPIAHADAAHGLYWLSRLRRDSGARDALPAHGAAASALARLLDALAGARASLDARTVSKASWATGQLFAAVPTALRSRAERALHAAASVRPAALDGRAIAAALHALATAAVRPSRACWLGLQERLAALLPDAAAFSPQDVSNLLWAVARLALPLSPPLHAALCHHLPPFFGAFKPIELSAATWALARLDGLATADRPDTPPEESPLVAAAHSALSRVGARAFNAHATANVIWGLAKIRPPPPAPLVASLLARAHETAPELSPQGAANLCSACARLAGAGELPLRPLCDLALALLSANSSANSANFAAADVGELAWSLGKLRIDSARRPEESADADADAWRAAARAVWSAAAVHVAAFDWRAAGHVAFLARALGDFAPAPASFGPKFAATTDAAVAAAQAERGALDAAATSALLGYISGESAEASTWAALPRHNTSALLMLAPSVGRCMQRVRDALDRRGLQVATWNRYADGRTLHRAERRAARRARDAGAHDGVGVRASAWPARAPRGGYALACLRVPFAPSSLTYAASAAAASLAPGGALLVFGCHVEGIDRAAERLRCLHVDGGDAPLFERVETLAQADTGGGGGGGGGCVVRAWRSAAAPVGAGPSTWREETTITLPPATTTSTAVARPWVSYPGLFAGGGVDVMTRLLLGALAAEFAEVPPSGRWLDFGCGSGTLGAWLRARGVDRHLAPRDLELTLLDADALAIDAAAANVAGATCVLSDGWAELPRGSQFDGIVSNPPVHTGLQTDFRVLRLLLRGAARRLAPGGTLRIVCQEYVPLERIAAECQRDGRTARLGTPRALVDDGRFVVWAATRVS